MTRTMSIYGLISGALAALGIVGTILLPVGNPLHESLWVGYLIMLVALSAILVGVKQYRDDVQGGVIGFGKAFLIGLGIAAVAGLAYAVVWEVYLALTHYSFTEAFINETLAAKRAAGVTGAKYQKAVADMEAFRTQYASPLFRVPMTFIEIFPVGLLVALVSAALLRNPRFLPMRARAA
jgi:NADH:ubiquinone oxidoreductase subunit K